MQITNVSIRMIENAGTLKAEATVTVGGDLAIHGIKVVEGKKGVFMSMPNRKGKGKDGEETYFDVVHPTTVEARKQLTDAVMSAYNGIAGTPAEN